LLVFGFGEVWLARNQTTGGLRALKVVPIRGTGSVDPAGREIVSLSRLEQTARVRDPNLVTIHHVGRTADYLFYIMDTADDVSSDPVSSGAEYTPAPLAVRLRCGSVAGDDCVRWSKQLLSALACLHREGLVHRDVKPSNCLFIDGQLKLADFGLLAQVDRSVSRVGTLQYMPPDGIMDTRADAEIWLDGRRLCQPDDQPWLTPCTVSGLSAELHTVVLKRRGLEDLELGRIDFGKTREVTAHWETANAVDSGTTLTDRPSVPISVP